MKNIIPICTECLLNIDEIRRNKEGLDKLCCLDNSLNIFRKLIKLV